MDWGSRHSERSELSFRAQRGICLNQRHAPRRTAPRVPLPTSPPPHFPTPPSTGRFSGQPRRSRASRRAGCAPADRPPPRRHAANHHTPQPAVFAPSGRRNVATGGAATWRRHAAAQPVEGTSRSSSCPGGAEESHAPRPAGRWSARRTRRPSRQSGSTRHLLVAPSTLRDPRYLALCGLINISVPGGLACASAILVGGTIPHLLDISASGIRTRARLLPSEGCSALWTSAHATEKNVPALRTTGPTRLLLTT